MLSILRVIALTGALWLSACAGRGAVQNAPAELPAADPVAAAIGRPEYRIGPSDLLSVAVFQIKDLDREVRVNNAGQVSLPLIGALMAAGQTVNELEGEIAKRYRSRYLQDPQVSVFVKEFASQRVTVGGSVTKPGIFPMTSSLTLLQAVALGGGVNDVANEHNVIVFRTAGGKKSFARFDLLAIREGKLPDPEIFGDDVIVVDDSTGKVFMKQLIQATPLLNYWIYNR